MAADVYIRYRSMDHDVLSIILTNILTNMQLMTQQLLYLLSLISKIIIDLVATV